MKRICILRTDGIWQMDAVWDTDVTPEQVNLTVGAPFAPGLYRRVRDTAVASYYAPQEDVDATAPVESPDEPDALHC